MVTIKFQFARFHFREDPCDLAKNYLPTSQVTKISICKKKKKKKEKINLEVYSNLANRGLRLSEDNTDYRKMLFEFSSRGCAKFQIMRI